MTVGELIEKLKDFPQNQRVVIYPDSGWEDVETVKTVFEDFVAIIPPDSF